MENSRDFLSEVVPKLIGKIVAWFEELPSRLTECGIMHLRLYPKQ